MSLHQTSLYLIQDHKFQDYGPDYGPKKIITILLILSAERLIFF